jgi:unsaturated rhamnogalacturonyl hydrolase
MVPASHTAIALRAFEKHKATHTLAHYTGILSLQGLARLAIGVGDAALIERARAELLPFVSGDRQFKCNFPNYLCGGNGAAFLFWRGHLPEVADHVRQCADQILHGAPRSREGIVTMPSAAGTDKIWIDAAFAVSPFLLFAGVAFQDERCITEAIDQALKPVALLRNPANGLVHQARGFSSKPGAISEDHWSRGNGWALLALTELVDALPATHPRRAEVEQVFRDLLEACLRVQDSAGLWHHELTLPTSFVETSGSGLILYALGTALKRGIVAAHHRAAFDRGLAEYRRYIGGDGSVLNTCEGCLSPGDGSIAAYLTKQPVTNDPHAFGPVIFSFYSAALLEKTNP